MEEDEFLERIPKILPRLIVYQFHIMGKSGGKKVKTNKKEKPKNPPPKLQKQ